MTEPRPRRATSPTATAAITASVEDYLKAIYELESASQAAATNALAETLKVAPASVSGMLRRLAEQGLLTHERYYGARLTPQGRAVALRILRRHRVIEAYLVQALGFGWDEVHEEAERLEHAASDALIDRMAKAIGEPEVDPHGAPIPARDGTLDEHRYPTLDRVPAGAAADIMRVADEDPDLLRHLAELELTPGQMVRVVQCTPFGGPITLQIGEQLHQIGPALAGRVVVKLRGEVPS